MSQRCRKLAPSMPQVIFGGRKCCDMVATWLRHGGDTLRRNFESITGKLFLHAATVFSGFLRQGCVTLGQACDMVEAWLRHG